MTRKAAGGRTRRLVTGFVLVAANLGSVILRLQFQAGTMREEPRLCRGIEKVQVDMLAGKHENEAAERPIVGPNAASLGMTILIGLSEEAEE